MLLCGQCVIRRAEITCADSPLWCASRGERGEVCRTYVCSARDHLRGEQRSSVLMSALCVMLREEWRGHVSLV